MKISGNVNATCPSRSPPGRLAHERHLVERKMRQVRTHEPPLDEGPEHRRRGAEPGAEQSLHLATRALEYGDAVPGAE